MALIKCPECGKDISDKSEKCIHCGYPINKERGEILYDIELQNVGENKIRIIALLRQLNKLSLQDAKNMAESVPCIIKKNLPLIDAKKIEDDFTTEGAVVIIKASDSTNNKQSIEEHDSALQLNNTKENNNYSKKTEKTKKSGGGCFATVFFVVAVMTLIGGLVQSCGGNSPSSSSSETCEVCHRTFTNSADVKSIIWTNMCESCYENYKYKQDMIDKALQQIEREK